MDTHYWHLLWIVGGTLVYGFFSFRSDMIFLGRDVWRHFRSGFGAGKKNLVERMVNFSALWICHSPEFDVHMREEPHPVLKEGLEFIREGLMDEKTLHRVFKARCDFLRSVNFKTVARLRELSKAPLAIGLFCAIYAMANHEPSMDFLFMGVGLCYFFFLPLADLVESSADRVHDEHVLLAEGLRLISARTNPVIMNEELNSYLRTKDRAKMKWLALGPGKRAA